MTSHTAFDRITVEPGKCGGKPCIRGMRITVRRVLEILVTYRRREEIFEEYPFLEEQDRVLLFQGLAPKAEALLRIEGWNAIHVQDVGLDRADDQDILEFARQHRRTCVTLDHDFHTHLALTRSEGPSVILIRLEGLNSNSAG